MRAYASLTLNMIEYTGLYLKKQSTKCAIILNVSNEVHSSHRKRGSAGKYFGVFSPRCS